MAQREMSDQSAGTGNHLLPISVKEKDIKPKEEMEKLLNGNHIDGADRDKVKELDHGCDACLLLILSVRSLRLCDFQADMCSDSREEGGEVPYRGRRDQLDVEYIQHINVQEDNVFQKPNCIRSSDSNYDEIDVGILNEYTSSILPYHVNDNGEKLSSYGAEVVINGRVSYDSDRSVADIADESFMANIQKNHLIWLPPEPDDIECSVANNDDDNEFSDGTKWAQPSSLGGFGGGNGMSNGYREECQKAMMEDMNGQFKFLVSRFLA